MGGKAEGGLGVGVQAGQSGVAGIQQKIACLADAAAQGYDLSLNRYKEIVHDDVEHRDPLDIIADLEQLEAEITTGLAELKAMLS